MKEFTNKWFDPNIPLWEDVLARFKTTQTKALEIGSYEGRSSCRLLDNILLSEGSTLLCVDTFEGSMEMDDESTLLDRWKNNTKDYSNVNYIKGLSSESLVSLCGEEFDFIFIDASHTSADVLQDGVLAFNLLSLNGILIFDDYKWAMYEESELTPKLGIDSFLDAYKGHYELLHKDFQVVIRKTKFTIEGTVDEDFLKQVESNS